MDLATAFLDSWSGAFGGPPDSLRALDDALDVALAAGSGAWPLLTVDPPRFVAFLAARVDDATQPVEALAALHVEDLYLACACLSGDAAALTAFERAQLTELGIVGRVSSNPAFVDEVRQRLRVHLFVGDGKPPKIGEYGGRGALSAWVRVVALRLAQMLWRAGWREAHGDAPESAEDELALAKADPELELIKRRYGRAFSEAVSAALLSIDARDRTVLKLNVLDGLNIAKIGALYGVHRATVAAWIAAARRAILDDTRRRLTAELRLDAGELDSLMGLVRSQLNLRLSQLLG